MALKNKAAMEILVQSIVKTFFFLRKYIGIELLDHRVGVYLII